MRKILLAALSGILLQTVHAQQAYWQQQVNYTIDVTLNDKDHSLDGFEKIEYINNSPDTLRFIWFHLWPNAYKNDKTAFTDQHLENGNTSFYFSSKEQKGYINRLDFKINNTTATLEDHPHHIDIVKLILPTPLPPGQKTNITTSFHVKLPYNFSRGGHDGQSYQVTQWYPKPAVYDKDGWHPMPYLDQGEFYSEFGSFDVSITLPNNYVVAATGELRDEAEKKWLNEKAVNFERELKALSPPQPAKKSSSFGPPKPPAPVVPASSTQLKTLRYRQNNIHDFAWFADKRFIVRYDTCHLSSGRVVDVYSFVTPESFSAWRESNASAIKAIKNYSKRIGEYPYNVVSVVQGPQSFGGGMEYPTITVISPDNNSKELNATIVHEVGHNWFYGILGSNERKYPWMDEGINSYYDDSRHFSSDSRQNLLETLIAEKRDQPIQTSSEEFNAINYELVAYYKASEWVKWLQQQLGLETFDKAMQEYYRRWQFKHPQPEDLQQVMEEVSGQNLDSAFAMLKTKGPLPGWERKGMGIQGPLGYVLDAHHEKNTAITFSLAVGFNSYDKAMIGGLITNLRRPPNKLQFLAIPMYATGSKSFAGLGFVNYSFYPDGFFRKIDIGVSGSTFTFDRYEDAEGDKLFFHFQKIAPGIRLTLKEKSPRSTIHRYIQFKTFLIGEDDLLYRTDSIFSPTDTIIVDNSTTTRENRTLNQLTFVIDNYRALYPYRGELKIEQGKDFVRAGFTGKYFFNYPKGGGLNLRFFAGKFFYTSGRTSSKELATFRYHLNLLAPSGYEDYTYSDYFIGRSEFTGIASQQVMERDGALKLRLEQFEGDPVFRSHVLSDDWIMAVNLSTTIPKDILPPFIPLKLFADIGTSAGMWDKDNPYGKFAFVAGFQLSFFKNLINIYAPLLYTNEFKNLLITDPDNNKFLKKISFSIDISNFSFRKFDRNFDF